jgi:hypothetical protein
MLITVTWRGKVGMNFTSVMKHILCNEGTVEGVCASSRSAIYEAGAIICTHHKECAFRRSAILCTHHAVVKKRFVESGFIC